MENPALSTKHEDSGIDSDQMSQNQEGTTSVNTNNSNLQIDQKTLSNSALDSLSLQQTSIVSPSIESVPDVAVIDSRPTQSQQASKLKRIHDYEDRLGRQASDQLLKRLERRRLAKNNRLYEKRTQILDRTKSTQRRSGLTSKNQKSGVSANDSSSGDTADYQPLVTLAETDSGDEDEFLISSLRAQQDIKDQLMKDGFDLDLQSDDGELDLIPPKPMHNRCNVCGYCAVS